MASGTPRAPSEKIETWLRYYDDLRIKLFYIDRGLDRGLGADGARDRASGPENALPVAQFPISAATEAPLVQQAGVEQAAQPVPGAARSAAGQRAAAAAPTSSSRVQVQGIVHGPSLFEAAERVEGDTLERICGDLGDCTRCKLHRHRNKIVFGAGNPRAELVFVGEGPGHDEDVQGLPFVGRAGQLLTQMIEAMGLNRSEVYIANIVKCRPPENRTPEKDEVATCLPFLLRQLAAIGPKIIVSLGSVATQTLLGTNKSISSFRGEWFDFRGARLMATYHPAYLLRNPNAKPEVWGDLKKVMAVLGLKAPPPKRKS